MTPEQERTQKIKTLKRMAKLDEQAERRATYDQQVDIRNDQIDDIKARIDRLTATRDQMAKESKSIEEKLGLALQNQKSAQASADHARNDLHDLTKATEHLSFKIVSASPLGSLREGKSVEDHLNAIIARARMIDDMDSPEAELAYLTEAILEGSPYAPDTKAGDAKQAVEQHLGAILRGSARAVRELKSMTKDRDQCAEERDAARAKLEYITGMFGCEPSGVMDAIEHMIAPLHEHKRTLADAIAELQGVKGSRDRFVDEMKSIAKALGCNPADVLLATEQMVSKLDDIQGIRSKGMIATNARAEAEAERLGAKVGAIEARHATRDADRDAREGALLDQLVRSRFTCARLAEQLCLDVAKSDPDDLSITDALIARMKR